MAAPKPTPVSVPAADQRWAAVFSDDGPAVVRGAARVGDLVVDVEVTNPPGGGTAEVERLLQAVTSELVSDGLPATGR